jgi:hypothetical protein
LGQTSKRGRIYNQVAASSLSGSMHQALQLPASSVKYDLSECMLCSKPGCVLKEEDMCPD